jgi:hypothetical protein
MASYSTLRANLVHEGRCYDRELRFPYAGETIIQDGYILRESQGYHNDCPRDSNSDETGSNSGDGSRDDDAASIGLASDGSNTNHGRSLDY